MKQASRLMIYICIFALLTGCGLSDSVLRRYGDSDSLMAAETQEVAVLETQPPIFPDDEPLTLWGRSQLDEHSQAAYDQMSEAIAAYQETPLVVDVGPDEIQRILTALRMDHPEYFWFEGQASFVTTTLAGVTVQTECTLTYTMERQALEAAHYGIVQYAADCLSALEQAGAATDYDRILGVYRYIIESTDYVSAETDQSILCVTSRHQATCAGYARTFQYLMGQLGIPCTLAIGEMEGGAPHGWNVVQCDGQWYQMDVTWGDPVEPDGQPGHTIQYTYCLVTDEEIYRDHTLDSSIPMPVCTAVSDNYFVREGLQLDTWDPEAYTVLMAKAVAQGQDSFDVRFSNRDAYEAAMDSLFRQEQIWDIFQAAGAGTQTQINYSSKDLHLEISVRLHSGGN